MTRHGAYSLGGPLNSISAAPFACLNFTRTVSTTNSRLSGRTTYPDSRVFTPDTLKKFSTALYYGAHALYFTMTNNFLKRK